jgi:arylsulfatase A-like enzyme
MNERSNVLLVVLDSTRAKNTSLQGYDRETTPFLSEFADRSTVYTQARAPGIHSIASHVSMFTGAHVEEHRAFHHTAQIDPTRTIWHELGSEFGYDTALFTNNRIVSNASNLSASFDHRHEPNYPLAERLENRIDDTVLEQLYFRWHDALSQLTDGGSEGSGSGGQGRPAGLVGGLSDRLGTVADAAGLSGDGSSSGYKTLFGGEFTDAFAAWETERTGPWAACINLMDTHEPYEPEAEYDRWADDENWRIQREDTPSVWESLQGRGWDRIAALEGLYDGTILQADAILRDLVGTLEQRGVLSDTLLVVTSDHGETFSERSRLNERVRLRAHKWGIHEELTHVPLVVSYPGQEEGEVVEQVVSLTDTPDLLRAATENDPEDPLVSDDPVLASTFRLPESKRSKYGSIDDIDTYIGPWRAVYENHEGGVRKYARKGDFALTADIVGAGDVSVVSRDDDGRVSGAYDRLSDGDIVTEEAAEIDEELEQQLEDLGYIR